MIRLFKSQDSKAVVDLWYEASIIAHNFIAESYWQEKKLDMQHVYIPSSITYVYEQENEILGFVSLVENYRSYFCSTEYARKRNRKRLDEFCKTTTSDIAFRRLC
jgi:putative acetyltransferase